MVKGETVMPVPHGIISTSEGPVDPNLELIQEEVIEEVKDEDIKVEE